MEYRLRTKGEGDRGKGNKGERQEAAAAAERDRGKQTRGITKRHLRFEGHMKSATRK